MVRGFRHAAHRVHRVAVLQFGARLQAEHRENLIDDVRRHLVERQVDANVAFEGWGLRIRVLWDNVVILVADAANGAQVEAHHLAMIDDIRRRHRNLLQVHCRRAPQVIVHREVRTGFRFHPASPPGTPCRLTRTLRSLRRAYHSEP
jgi:hypothetical protein